VAPDNDVLVIVTDLAVEFAVHGIPFEQMGQCVGVSKIVYRANALDLFLLHRAKNVAPDATESVDSVICHRKIE
jgi:hypothetical protein